MLTITPGLPSSAKGATGLTGTFDDNKENDLTYLNGTGYISVNSSESDIFEWASTCKFSLPIYTYRYLQCLYLHVCVCMCKLVYLHI